MLKRFSIAPLMTLFLSLPSTHARPVNIEWAVLKTDKEITTALNVKQYVENYLISDQEHALLFKATQNNFSTYKDHLKKLTDQTFTQALKRMAFIRLAQALAIKQTQRGLFKISKNDFNNLVSRKVSTILKLQRSKGLQDKDSINGLVEDLKKSGFPYGQDESSIDIYKRWYKRMTIQTRENYRETEAIKYVCSLGNCKLSSPLEILKSKSKLLNSAYLRVSPEPGLNLRGSESFDFIFNSDLKFKTQESAKEKDKRFIFIGEIKDTKVELKAINDWDITGALEPLGYPDTDDMGRTSGLMLNYIINGTDGSLSVELEDWLFSEELGEINDIKQQNVEEEATLRITSRKFLDPQGKTWLVVGFSANHRIQKAAAHSWIQDAFHKLNSKTSDRNNIPRDGNEIYLEGIIGLGGEYSILEKPHVDIKLKGEALLLPTAGTMDRSKISFSSSLDANFYGKHRDYPILYASVFGKYSFLTDKTEESVIGAKVGLGAVYKRVYFQVSLFVIRWDEDLDRRYEGGASWTTGVALSTSMIKRTTNPEFEFN